MKMETIDDFSYMDYFKNLTDADRKLLDSIYEYEELFDDFNFAPTSVVSKYVKFEEKIDGEWTQGSRDLLLTLGDNQYRYYIREFKNSRIGGQTNSRENIILISPSNAENKKVILHEMIHAYENIINDRLSPFYHDILLLCLYNYLKDIVPDIDARILDHSHMIHGDAITLQGGSHDILFFLKSLDLDLRCGYEWGTVCGYGREDFVTKQH